MYVRSEEKLVFERIAASERWRGDMIAAEFVERDETLPWHVVVCFGGGKETGVLLEHRVSTDGHCVALREFGVMPFFDCKLAVANVAVRADDCTAEFVTGGVCNREE